MPGVRQPLLRSVPTLAALAAVASWALSFAHPHAFPLSGGYRARFERGTMQLRRQQRMRLVADAAGRLTVIPAPPPGPATPGPELGGPNGTMLLFSPWRPFSTGSFVSGGSVIRVDGTQADFGYRLEAWAVAHGWSRFRSLCWGRGVTQGDGPAGLRPADAPRAGTTSAPPPSGARNAGRRMMRPGGA